MTKNELIGILLVLIGIFDFFLLPKLFQFVWKKAQKEPSWGGVLNIIARAVGGIFIFFGISYYLFGQLE